LHLLALAFSKFHKEIKMPIGYQAKSLIEAQVLYQDSQREEIAELNATAPDVTDAPVVEAEAQQAPNVAS
jgi:hypothetical protein